MNLPMTYALRFFLLWGLMGYSANLAWAQKVIIIDKMGIKHKRSRYFEGDMMSVKVKNDKTVYTGEVHSISDTSFFLNENKVFIDSMTAVVKYSKAAKASSLTSFAVAAVTGTIAVLDNTLNKNDINPENSGYAVPLFFTGLGAALMPFWKQTLRIKENRIVKIIDLTPK